jgi:hypothetical protein
MHIPSGCAMNTSHDYADSQVYVNSMSKHVFAELCVIGLNLNQSESNWMYDVNSKEAQVVWNKLYILKY